MVFALSFFELVIGGVSFGNLLSALAIQAFAV
jgi:hypothetical protein